MRYLSLFSGIEAATVAFRPLGWTPFGFAEIERFPSAVLAHHYGSNMPGELFAKNGVPNFGDVNNYKEWPDGSVDLICGGSPCQSFSVAGLRKGLDDPRGNMALVYLGVVDKYRPRWVVFENVPGLLSSNGGRDFGSFLGALAELGYGFAYRVLDAQYVRVDGFGRAVPQRRRRVFVVGYLGDWRRAAAVLFEPAGMLRNTPPRRKSGQRPAPTISARTSGGGGLGTDFELDGGQTAVENAAFGGGNTSDEPRSVSAALTAKGQRLDFEVETFVVSGHGGYSESDTPTLRASGGDVQGGSEGLVAHSLRGEGFDASEDGTGRGTPIVPVYAIQERAVSENPDNGPQGKGYQADVAYTLEARNKTQGVVHSLSAPEVADTLSVGANQTTGFSGDDIACRNAVSIDMRNAARDPDKRDAVNRQGVGIGDDCAHTVSASHVNAVCYGLSTQQEPKWTEDVSPTLAGPSPTGGGQVTAVAFSMRGRDGGAMPEAERDEVAPAARAEKQTYIAFSSKDYGADAAEEVSPTLRAGGHDTSHANAGNPPAIAVFDPNQITSKTNRSVPQPGVSHTLPATPNSPVAFDWYASESQSLPIEDGLCPPLKTTMQPAVQSGWAVRRLTPRECERLQGFPDDYTQIPNWDGWREVGKDESIEELKAAGLTIKPSKNGFRVNDPDGVRYKALGNSMAVNVMRWIGWRIDHFEKLVSEGKIPE